MSSLLQSSVFEMTNKAVSKSLYSFFVAVPEKVLENLADWI